MITSRQAAILKHFGKTLDIKVTVTLLDGKPVLHIQDYEFDTYDKALRFLQEAARYVIQYDISIDKDE